MNRLKIKIMLHIIKTHLVEIEMISLVVVELNIHQQEFSSESIDLFANLFKLLQYHQEYLLKSSSTEIQRLK